MELLKLYRNIKPDFIIDGFGGNGFKIYRYRYFLFYNNCTFSFFSPKENVVKLSDEIEIYDDEFSTNDVMNAIKFSSKGKIMASDDNIIEFYVEENFWGKVIFYAKKIDENKLEMSGIRDNSKDTRFPALIPKELFEIVDVDYNKIIEILKSIEQDLQKK
jgi:hypothetical protein